MACGVGFDGPVGDMVEKADDKARVKEDQAEDMRMDERWGVMVDAMRRRRPAQR